MEYKTYGKSIPQELNELNKILKNQCEQIMVKFIRYKNKEFCIDIKCNKLSLDKTNCTYKGCIKSAKDFHHWLNENNFCISKCIKSE